MTRDFRWLGASAKLKPDMTLGSAQVGMNIIAQRIAHAYPNSSKGWSVAVDRLADVLISPSLHSAVTVLFTATLFVLLIGCANLANLALARGISRENEMAVRAALGASRRRLVLQLLIENVVISMCGGIGGVAIGYAMMKWIQSLIPPETLPPAVDNRMGASVVLFTLTAAVMTGLLFGAAPAAQITNPTKIGAVKEGGHGTTRGSRGRRVRGFLVVAEIALAFMLLVGSGLLMRSSVKLLDVDPGFDATNVLTAGLHRKHQGRVTLSITLVRGPGQPCPFDSKTLSSPRKPGSTEQASGQILTLKSLVNGLDAGQGYFGGAATSRLKVTAQTDFDLEAPSASRGESAVDISIPVRPGNIRELRNVLECNQRS
jgi:hypothetical protein